MNSTALFSHTTPPFWAGLQLVLANMQVLYRPPPGRPLTPVFVFYSFVLGDKPRCDDVLTRLLPLPMFEKPAFSTATRRLSRRVCWPAVLSCARPPLLLS